MAVQQEDDDKGLGVIRIKPLGIGGGGEQTSTTANSPVRYTETSVTIDTKSFTYPTMVIPPNTDQNTIFHEFMPNGIDAFLSGYNVNLIAYGQTGSGKTYTMFGPQGCMEKAGKGEYGYDTQDSYGLFPHGIIEIFYKLQELRRMDTSHSYVMTCSAVENSVTGNEDMFQKSGTVKTKAEKLFRSWGSGVVLSRSEKPPRLYGQNEVIIRDNDDILRVFSALAVRNTSGTMMNDTSSRSHCIVTLHLWKSNQSSGKVLISRFQFCDLAGSERMEDTHVQGAKLKNVNGEWNMDVAQGLATNFSLMELSRCLQDIATAQKSKGVFNFRTYVTDLPFILSDSLVGNALTACFICISQAERNKAESRSALDFGSRFSRLKIKRRRTTEKALKDLEKEARASIVDNEKHLKSTRAENPYAVMRQAQIRDSEQILDVIKELGLG